MSDQFDKLIAPNQADRSCDFARDGVVGAPTDATPPITYVQKQTPLWKRIAKRAGAVSFWGVLGVVCALAILIYVIPQAKAGAGLTVLTSSMETSGSIVDSVKGKNISPGDVVAVKGIKAHEVCEGIQVGDVVTYMPEADDATLVTHRVHAINRLDKGDTIGEDTKYETCTVQMKGDNNNVADPVVPARAVKGVVMYTVPKVGYALNAIQTSAGVQNVAYGIAGALALTAVFFVLPRYAKIREPEYHI